MKRFNHNKEYMMIINPILKNENFNQLENIKHHNSNRLDHSMKVSYYSYMVAKMLHLSYEEVARGGLLHDFYLNRTTDYKNVKDKVLLYTVKHPQEALYNASNYFEISDMEADMIKSHMFPVDFRVPKYAESWIVSFVDKFVSAYEFCHKFSYQLVSAFNLYLIYLVNFIK